MPETLLWLTAVVAGLLALAFWWVRRNNLAAYPVGRAPRELRPLPAGCEIGQALLATAVETGGGGATAGGGAPAPAKTPTPAKPPKPPRRSEHLPSRRAFLRNTWLLSWAGVLAGFSGASIAFLWPNLKGGFGARLPVASEEEILASIRENREPYAFRSGRTYLVEYDPALDPDGSYAELTSDAKVMALYQKCVHLGCTVPWCAPSQWFECPCHGSRYNRWGEWQFGPAPRGLDRFAIAVEDGVVVVDTSRVITGPTRTGGVLVQAPEGPHCT